MHLRTTLCFIQAMNCAQRAFDEPSEKARHFLRHLEASWIAAARREHEQLERPADLFSLRSPITSHRVSASSGAAYDRRIPRQYLENHRAR